MQDSKFQIEFSDSKERSFDFTKCSTIKAEQMIIEYLLKEGWEFHSAAAVPFETMPMEWKPKGTLFCTFIRKYIYFTK